MGYDVVASGNPLVAGYPAGGRTAASAIDTNVGAEWVALPQSGWQPVSSAFARAFVLATTAAQAALLVVTAPVSGLYVVNMFANQNTATNGTLPNFTVTYTDVDTGTSVTDTVTGTATTGIGQAQSAQVVINAKANTTITVASAAPTTLTANVKARISFLG
jgi:hypothetical protein